MPLWNLALNYLFCDNRALRISLQQAQRVFSPWRDPVRGETAFLVLACCVFLCFLLAPLGHLAGTRVSVLAGAPCRSLTPSVCSHSASSQPQPQPSDCLSAPPRADPTWPSCSPASGGMPHGRHPPRCSWPGPVPYTLGCVSPWQELISHPWVLFATCMPDVFLCTLEGCFCLPGTYGPAPIWATLKLLFRPTGSNQASPLILVLTSERRLTTKLVLPWKLSLSWRVFLSVLWHLTPF